MVNFIQNAVKVNDTYYVSTHRHDYVEFEIDGKTYFIDGGNDYQRSNVILSSLNVDFTYTLTDEDDYINKLLWGTRGPSGTSPVKYILIKDMQKDHLEKCLEIPNLCPYRKETMEFWLDRYDNSTV